MDVVFLRGNREAVTELGYGYGDGDGYGYGYGYGYGDGDGYGYGDGDLVAAQSQPHAVTGDMLAKAGACAEAVNVFRRVFPGGGTWPDDIVKARRAGLDVSWCRRLGLLESKQ